MPDIHGPYRQVRFILEIDGITRAGFTACRLPASSTDVIEYREGNDPPTARKLAGQTRYSPLVLKSGVTDDSIELFEWRQAVEHGDVDEARRPIAVTLLDAEGNPGARWEMRNAWPQRYVGPPLDASGTAVAIETLEVVIEGFERDQ